MLIHLLAETPSKVAPIRAIVEPVHRLVPIDTNHKQSFAPHDVLMIDFDLRNETSVARVREVLRKAGKLRHKLFVVDKKSHSLMVQAHALEATGTVTRPLDRDELLGRLAALDNAARHVGLNPPPSTDLGNSAAVFASMFSAILTGAPIEFADAKRATEQIINSVSQRGLTAWLDDVRRHHEGTFQHCLLVSGVATSFAINLGFSSADVYRLGLAATLHDVESHHTARYTRQAGPARRRGGADHAPAPRTRLRGIEVRARYRSRSPRCRSPPS